MKPDFVFMAAFLTISTRPDYELGGDNSAGRSNRKGPVLRGKSDLCQRTVIYQEENRGVMAAQFCFGKVSANQSRARSRRSITRRSGRVPSTLTLDEEKSNDKNLQRGNWTFPLDDLNIEMLGNRNLSRHVMYCRPFCGILPSVCPEEFSGEFRNPKIQSLAL